VTKTDTAMLEAREAIAASITASIVEWARKHAPSAEIGEVFALADAIAAKTYTPIWEAFHLGQNAAEINSK
jgi:hypothetical protein